MAEQLHDRPLLVGRPFPQVLAGRFDNSAPGLELGLLDLERIVRAERIQDGLAVGVGILGRHPDHRASPGLVA